MRQKQFFKRRKQLIRIASTHEAEKRRFAVFLVFGDECGAFPAACGKILNGHRVFRSEMYSI